MTGYTEGPWTIGVVAEEDASWFEVRGSADGDGWMTVIADMIDSAANARLIAAAPDMAEALAFYADPEAWRHPPVETVAGEFGPAYVSKSAQIQKDRGAIARAALARAKGAAS